MRGSFGSEALRLVLAVAVRVDHIRRSAVRLGKGRRRARAARTMVDAESTAPESPAFRSRAEDRLDRLPGPLRSEFLETRSLIGWVFLRSGADTVAGTRSVGVVDKTGILASVLPADTV